MCEYWKEVWNRKGKADTDDLNELDGYNTVVADIQYIANSIIGELEIKSTDRVLEVGCGAGALAQYLTSYCKEYIGIDYTKSLVDKHIKILQNSVLVAEANDIPFKDNYFDKSFSYSVFHYFQDKEYAKKAFDEMKRVTIGNIYVGDLPPLSHRKEHLLFSANDFDDGIISGGLYNPIRFNLTFKR